jgi:hypothetical protein
MLLRLLLLLLLLLPVGVPAAGSGEKASMPTSHQDAPSAAAADCLPGSCT